MFNVSGLSLWSALIHPLFHTTQMDKEIFYHHYRHSFKPKIIIVDRQWGVIHNGPLWSHLWTESRLSSGFLNSEFCLSCHQLIGRSKLWKRGRNSARWLSGLYSYKMLIMRGRWQRGGGGVYRKVWTLARNTSIPTCPH